MSNKLKNKKQKGFTLIELLVSIALFSVVLTIGLGSMLTVTDSNKKARTLVSVMNNLNFAVDSMTRSFKTGDTGGGNPVTGGSGGTNPHCFETTEADGDAVTYCWDKTNKSLTRDGVALTSPDIEIQYANFSARNTGNRQQPILIITLEGQVKVTDEIKSDFTIHTSVAQRKLNI